MDKIQREVNSKMAVDDCYLSFTDCNMKPGEMRTRIDDKPWGTSLRIDYCDERLIY